MGVEELGLGLAAVAPLAVPPCRTIAIDDVTGSTGDSDATAREGDKRSVPLLVSECRSAFEGDLDNFERLFRSCQNEELTVVPSVRSVMSNVVPAGTVMPLRTMLEQELLPEMAAEALVKVHPEAAGAEELFAASTAPAVTVSGAAEVGLEATLAGTEAPTLRPPERPGNVAL